MARKMIAPVATRLQALLKEDPSRSNSSLIFSGHSAGGAIAALLFAHMSSQEVISELTVLRQCKLLKYYPSYLLTDLCRLQKGALRYVRNSSDFVVAISQAQLGPMA